MIRNAFGDWVKSLFSRPREDAQIKALRDWMALAEAQAHEQAGAAYKARADLNDALAANAALVEQLAQACRERDEWRDLCGKRTAALHQIAARVTASPNAASRDMARIAREALE